MIYGPHYDAPTAACPPFVPGKSVPRNAAGSHSARSLRTSLALRTVSAFNLVTAQLYRQPRAAKTKKNGRVPDAARTRTKLGEGSALKQATSTPDCVRPSLLLAQARMLTELGRGRDAGAGLPERVHVTMKELRDRTRCGLLHRYTRGSSQKT